MQINPEMTEYVGQHLVANDQHFSRENLLIIRRWHAQAGSVVNKPKDTRSRPYARPADGDKMIDRFTHNFSPTGQGTLYPVKVFGIISLFECCRESSTAADPLYDECGCTIAYS